MPSCTTVADLARLLTEHGVAIERWRHPDANTVDDLFRELVRDRKNQYLMLDSTIVRAHQQAATGRKKGGRTRLWGVPEEV